MPASYYLDRTGANPAGIDADLFAGKKRKGAGSSLVPG
jgi:hypothetical protein